MLLRRWWCFAALTFLISSTSKAETPPEPARLWFKAVPAEQSGLTHVVNGEPERGEAKYPWMSPPVDVNGDGKLDVIVYGHHGGGAAIWLGRGDGTFQLDDGPYTKRWQFGGRDPVWWIVGEAKAPHAVGTEGSGISGAFFMNDGSGLFRKTALTVAESGFGGFQFVDLDGDGFHREIFMSTSGIAVRPNPSLETWPTAGDAASTKSKKLWESEPLVGWPSGVERGRGATRAGYRDAYAVDLDGDDKNELMVHFRSEGFSSEHLFTWMLYRNQDSAEPWKEKYPSPRSTDGIPRWLFPEDVDVDGKLDLVDLHSGDWYFGHDEGHTRHASRVFDVKQRKRGRPWTPDNELQWLDLDNNGYRDLVTASDHGSGFGVFLNMGSGDFLETSDVPGTRRNRKFGDVDGDGRIDMITFEKGRVTLYRNQCGFKGLHVRLVPKHAADAHLGAKLWVYEAGKLDDAKSLVHYRQGFMERDAGRSTILGGPLHVGLGNRETVDVRVRFPSGTVREAKGVNAGGEVVVREDS